MVIFYSYRSLPEGTWGLKPKELAKPNLTHVLLLYCCTHLET